MSHSTEVIAGERFGKYFRIAIEDGSTISFQGNEAAVVERLLGGPCTRLTIQGLLNSNGKLSQSVLERKTDRAITSANIIFHARRSFYHIYEEDIEQDGEVLPGFALHIPKEDIKQKNENPPNYTSADGKEVFLTPLQKTFADALQNSNRARSVSLEKLGALFDPKGEANKTQLYYRIYSYAADLNSKLKAARSKVRIRTRRIQLKDHKALGYYIESSYGGKYRRWYFRRTWDKDCL